MNYAISRRMFLGGAAGAVAAGPYVILRPGWAQTGPIKIGLLEPQSGPTKYVGDANTAAARFAVERINARGGVLGRRMEVVVADSEFKVDVGTRRANDLLLGEKVDFIAALGASIAPPVAQLAHQQKKLFISPHTVPSEMTGKDFLPTTFVCALNTEMLANALATYFARQAPVKPKKLYLLNQDYNNGRTASEFFKRKFNALKEPDQAILAEEFHPLFRVNDFASYITKIVASGADTVMTANWGADLRLLLQQGQQLGWKVRIGGFFLNDPTLTKAVTSAAVGHVTVGVHHITVDTPENRATVQAWKARFPDAPIFHRVPDLITGRGVNAWLWLGEVIQKAGSLDAPALIKAWEGTKYRGLWGEVEMRVCDHQMQSPCFVSEVMEPARIPETIRYFGTEFPYIGPATAIPKEAVSVPPRETGNQRCA
jgi:branched-chain amino acid transport system substrate-binding protein